MKVLKCRCQKCLKDFEIEADYLIPGVEGFMNLGHGQVKILDPTRTERMCDFCCEIELTKLMIGMEESAEFDPSKEEYR